MGVLIVSVSVFGVLTPTHAAGLHAVGSDSRERASYPYYQRWNNIELIGHYFFAGDVFEDKDLSGMACASNSRCLVGADEARMVQVVELSERTRTLTVLSSVLLLDSGDEIDIEAIAGQDNYYYITGSHGLSKKTGEVQQNRYRVFRLKVDPETGMPVGDLSRNTIVPADLQITTLSDILKNDPVLGPYFQKPLQHRGVNIEGLAAENGKLFFGFRSPNLGGKAYVMEIAADKLFALQGKKNYHLHSVFLGEGYGIREIVAAKSCFLIIAGNSGSEPSDRYPEAENYRKNRGYVMFSWDGWSPKAHRIGPLENPPGKAEAMLILSESKNQITVLILFDGAEKGKPTVYRIY